MAKRSAITAIIQAKCPVCREGDMFKGGPTYNLEHNLDMHEHCPKCGYKYEIEVGFFWGAMYVSYALNAGIFLAALTLLLIFDLPFVYFLIGLSILIVGLMPLLNRYSRVLMSHLFSGATYDPEVLNSKTVFSAESVDALQTNATSV
jgi:uncharacterized protein (DUF983 family)